MSNATPGWYHGAGDPEGTARYWDGNDWVGEPKAQHEDTTAPTAGRVASVGKRLGGRLIDMVIFVIIGLILLYPSIVDAFNGAIDLGPDASDSALQAAVEDALEATPTWRLAAIGIVSALYDWGFYAFKGATPGKLAVGTRVVSVKTGETPLGIFTGLLRALQSVALPVLSLLPVVADIAFWVPLGIGIASLVFLVTDDRRRTVMDRVASTIVINK